MVFLFSTQVFHSDGFVDIILEDRRDLLILFQRKFIQRDAFVDAEQYQLADDTVSITEWYAVVYKVVSSVSSVGKSVLGAGGHIIFVKFHCIDHAGEKEPDSLLRCR